MKNLLETWHKIAFTHGDRLNEAHPNSKIYDDCQDGYRKVPGKARGEKGSCTAEASDPMGDESNETHCDEEDPIEEGIKNWKLTIAESGFDKEKKDKMKCNSPRRLKSGEPGHGEKSKVVKACDPGSDKEKIIKFGDPNMPVQAHHKDNKASFRARHKCDDKSMDKDWDAAGYWACKDW